MITYNMTISGMHGTITAYEDGKAFAKYRAILSREEMEEAEYWTSDDIRCFIRRNEVVVLW